ncbi:MAG: lipocalin family protein [Bacteroidota bacterium]
MKNIALFFLLGIVLTSCKQDIKDADISKLNGYWEIEKVTLKDGEKKEYKVNPTIDYFQVKDKKGFRQKVMPQLDGTFETNNIKESISISENNGDSYINYSTDYGKWKEEIIAIEDSVLVLKNKEEIEYHYKKHLPFSLK